MTPTLDELHTQLDALKRQRGAALCDGQDFDSTEIAKLEIQIEALEDLEREQRRRDAERNAHDAAADRKAKAKTASKCVDGALLAWSDLQIGMNTVRGAIRRIKSSSEAARQSWVGEVPNALEPQGISSRIRGRVGEMLHTAGVGFQILGAGGIYLSAVTGDWKEDERKAMAVALKELTDRIGENHA